MQKGIQNEKDFAALLDGKKIKNLPINMQNLLYSIFDNANSESKIECWKSKYYEKADIKIRINGEIRGISIKTGTFCSMHQETTEKFYKFLSKIGVDNYIINMFQKFMLGFVKGKRVSAAIYVQHNQNDINTIRKKFNEYYIKTNLIIRFIFQGTEIQNYGCDAIIHGTPNKFLWATKDEILKYLTEYNIETYSHINVSALNIKSYDRNLRNNIQKIEKQEEIQVKWYSIEKDLKIITNLRQSNLKNNTNSI